MACGGDEARCFGVGVPSAENKTHVSGGGVRTRRQLLLLLRSCAQGHECLV